MCDRDWSGICCSVLVSSDSDIMGESVQWMQTQSGFMGNGGILGISLSEKGHGKSGKSHDRCNANLR